MMQIMPKNPRIPKVSNGKKVFFCLIALLSNIYILEYTIFDQILTLQNETDEDIEDADCEEKQSVDEQQSPKSKWRKTKVDLEFVSTKAYINWYLVDVS